MQKAILCLSLCLFSIQGQTANNSSFTDLELKTLAPFDEGVQRQVLKDVIVLMGETYDPDLPVPNVRKSESVGEDEIAIIAASESQGMPGWALAKGVNIYLHSLNLILIGEEMKIHNLAHEYAHYVQLQYKNFKKADFSMDQTEMSAVRVQNNFRIK